MAHTAVLYGNFYMADLIPLTHGFVTDFVYGITGSATKVFFGSDVCV